MGLGPSGGQIHYYHCQVLYLLYAVKFTLQYISSGVFLHVCYKYLKLHIFSHICKIRGNFLEILNRLRRKSCLSGQKETEVEFCA